MKNLIIDRRIVRNNIHAIKERAEGAVIIADLSANAGGMGLVPTAELLRDEGIKDFSVSDARDAAALRDAGFSGERIMMLRSTSDSAEIKKLLDHNVICTTGSYDAAVAINGLAETRGIVAPVQVKIDTGLGRYGFMPSELDRVAAIYNYMSNLSVIGTFTTYSDSRHNRKQTYAQYEIFNSVLDKLIDMGLEPGMAHACDSAALFKYDFGHMDAVRVETALSGRVAGKGMHKLEKVGFIEAGLEEVAWYPKGRSIGAERKIVTKAPMKVAVLSVGYYHGYTADGLGGERRIPSIFKTRRPFVTINGQKARVIGSVGLLHTMVDVTKIDCTVGDIAVLDADPVNVKGLETQYR